MFRRLSKSLPKDPIFPTDLEQLGYFVNEKDQIRSVEDPDLDFHYFISKNERVLEVHREAFDTCVRRNLAPRFENAGLLATRLPTTAGPQDPHIPILTTANLSSAKRIIIYLGEPGQDLGIFAYRAIGRQSIATGSCLKFVTDAIAQGPDVAVVIANLGQSLWYREGHRALTWKSWSALPKKTAVSPARVVGPGNKVSGHETADAHVSSVLDHVMSVMSTSAKIELIGICEGAEHGVHYLNANWDEWKNKVSCIAVGLGYIWDLDAEVGRKDFKDFIGKRARAFLIHQETLNMPLVGRKQMGCNTFSSGESQHTECLMPAAYSAMLEFFKLVNEVPGYEEGLSLADLVDESDDEKDDQGQDRGQVKYLPGNGASAGPGVSFSMPINNTHT